MAEPRVAELVGLREGGTLLEIKGGLADPVELRRWEPLPETADELCDVARAIGAPSRDIRLGTQATERAVKEMSKRGELTE
jgi:hypothetical protein